MSTFRPLHGTYETGIVVEAGTILLPTGSTGNATYNVSCFSAPSGQTGSLGHYGVERTTTGTWQMNMRDSFPSIQSVVLSAAPSGTLERGLVVRERYDLRQSYSGSNGGQGTIVFEVLSGSNVAPVPVDVGSAPLAVNFVITSRIFKGGINGGSL